MNLIGTILIAACLVYVAHFYWERLLALDKEQTEGEKRQARFWFKAWVIQGLAVPFLAWIICNTGKNPIIPPLVDEVASGIVGPGWFERMFALLPPAFFIITSYWGALTFFWFIVVACNRTDHRKEAVVTSVGWGLLMIPLIAAFIALFGRDSAGFILILGLLPVLHNSSIPIEDDGPPPNSYARAIAKMKFGKYAEAESEVIRELEKSENDFDGWLLLAELYANNFHDLSEADRTVRQLATEPGTTPSQIAVAFHRLADWHLKLADDPVSARRALDAINILLPGTHLARMAQLRINQLPASREQLIELRESGRTFRMPELDDTIEAGASASTSAPPETPPLDPQQATAQANACVAKLTQDPNDTAAREKFARLLAEHLGKTEAAIDQLHLLIAMPGQPDSKLAEWLALLASWQFSLQRDEAARLTLEKLVHEFPQSTQAFAAQRRLTLIAAEARVARLKAASRRLRLPAG